MELRNKTIVITGASDGIGWHTALRLAKEGPHLILLGRDQTRLNTVKKLCEGNGAEKVDCYSFDLSDRNSATDHLEKIRRNHKDIAILLNIAGIWQKKSDLDRLNHDEIEAIINTNLTGLIKVTNTLGSRVD